MESLISEAGSAVVAFSGGVDSALLVYLTHSLLGEKMLAVTAESPSYPRYQLREALDFAGRFGIPHLLIESREIDNPLFQANNPDRCYHCKKDLLTRLLAISRERGFKWVFEGTNVDDHSDYRPGRQAVRELGVRSPFSEAGLTKEDIRFISRHENLPTWDKPASACLSSRIPYREVIDEAKLKQIEKAEDSLRALGFKLFRIRHHGDMARLEISPSELPKALARGMFGEISSRIKSAGFTFAALDLDGYRTGSLNETLSRKTKTTETSDRQRRSESL